MIQLDDLSMIFRAGRARKVVADRITATFPTGRAVALLGRNGAGKSTLLRIIAGTQDPTRGRVVSSGSISWPVGFAGSFHPKLTGVQNTRFVARIYGADTDALVRFVEEFAALGPHFRLPCGTYSAGMRSRLAFGVSMGMGFDTYLVDEVTSVGDAAFRAKSAEVFRARMQKSGAIVVSHSMPQIRQLCDMGAVLEAGQLHLYEDLEEAIAVHEANMAVAA
ncbi:ABC transporter ATP-binding protein [Pseudooceanicola sediminis]|uniref:ABC transporter ATP-binding protein n=1 Tax=Pseudooceanicola sediminis TaxID=2211117 RepID=A0A399J1K0_9RHOB|nr:ABC transporter ATP-binding protein [Pseudooceanicola sediminis]KAA2313665.1 ABC transporter ATP-binding protein [Puniceibacterium sp. HSS470]RII38497.1 ABC transporter ATP-binding protein [Pseudooceanicola sediminis]|tara:strand:+ start:63376 stop:64038 length:663 start_codon:yes stop_codon:yes gene_type:complete